GIGSPGNAALELSETVIIVPQLLLPRLIFRLIDALWWDDFRTRDECIVRGKHTQCAHLLCDRSPVTLDAANHTSTGEGRPTVHIVPSVTAPPTHGETHQGHDNKQASLDCQASTSSTPPG